MLLYNSRKIQKMVFELTCRRDRGTGTARWHGICPEMRRIFEGCSEWLENCHESKAVRDQQFQKMREEQLKGKARGEAKRLRDLEEAKKRRYRERMGNWAAGIYGEG